MGIPLCLQRTAYMGMLPTCKCSRCTFHLLCHRDSSCVTPHRAVALLALITSVGDALWGLEAVQLLPQPAALPRAGCIWVAEAEHSFPSIGSLSHWITTATTGSSPHPRVRSSVPSLLQQPAQHAKDKQPHLQAAAKSTKPCRFQGSPGSFTYPHSPFLSAKDEDSHSYQNVVISDPCSSELGKCGAVMFRSEP